MQSKLEKTYQTIAVLALVGFFGGMRLMNWQLKSERRQSSASATPLPQNVELTIRGKAHHDQKQFQAIRSGMDFREVMKTLHIVRTVEKVGPYLMNKNVTVRFMNPDNSSIDVDLRYARVVSKRMTSRAANLNPQRTPYSPPADEE